MRFSTKPNRRKLFTIRRVVGNSMLPTLTPDSVIVAWRTRRLRAGNVIVAYQAGRLVVKRIVAIHRGSYEIHGDNSSMSIDSRQRGTIKNADIIGRVIWPIRAYKNRPSG